MVGGGPLKVGELAASGFSFFERAKMTLAFSPEAAARKGEGGRARRSRRCCRAIKKSDHTRKNCTGKTLAKWGKSERRRNRLAAAASASRPIAGRLAISFGK
jgi:uncharacterized protein (DUF2336 family)